MKRSELLLVGCSVMGLHTVGFAQHYDKDSLWNVWNDTGRPDTARLNAIARLNFDHYLNDAPDSAWVLSGLQYDLATRTANWRYSAQALNMQGVMRNWKGDPAGAFALFERSFEHYERSGYRKGLAAALANAAHVPLDQGYTDKALELLHRAAVINRELKNEQGEMQVLALESSIYSQAGETEKALKIDSTLLEFAERSGARQQMTAVLGNIGLGLGALGRRKEALMAMERALALGMELHDERSSALNLMNMGFIHLEERRLADALDLFDRSIDLCRKLEDVKNLTVALRGGGRTYFAMGHPDKAMARCRESLSLAEGANNWDEVVRACECLYEIHRDQGDQGQALLFLERMHAAEDSLQYQSSLKALQLAEFREQLQADSLRVEEEKRRLQETANAELRAERDRKLLAVGGGAAVLVLAFVLWRRLGHTRREKARSEEILHNVLPEEVAREIRETGTAKSRQVDQVSVIFTDFKGFTELSAALSHEALMEEIDACFLAFDHIMGKHDIEKIKTIGDAYMAAAGLKGDAHDAAVRAVRAALEMQAFVEARHVENTRQGLSAFRMRVGIHTGPVVAGIVGVKKFQYDIWGDTVNTASRMESSGEVGQVNISEATYALVKAEPGLTFIPRGKVQAKGKGEMEMFFVSRSLGEG